MTADTDFTELCSKATPELLGQWLIPNAILETAIDLDGDDIDVPAEVLAMMAIFRHLAEDTADHANDQDADDSPLQADETRTRADLYQQSYDALRKVWKF